MAQKGAVRLASELDSVHATRAEHPHGAQPFTSVVGHSYGTTTAAKALSQTNYAVDAVALVASAGVGSGLNPDLASFHVEDRDGHVQIYTTQASDDNIATIGRGGGILRGDPAQPFSGAIRYGSNGTFIDGVEYKATNGHDPLGWNGGAWPMNASRGHGYFDKETESLFNTAAASLGRGQDILPDLPGALPGPAPSPPPGF